MVLPEPAAHDAPDQAVGWLDEVALALRLSLAATITLIDKAHPARLGDLVRTLRHEWPDIDVIADVGKVVDVPVGSTIVLAPRKEDADWLNLHRGKFSDRRLKVVLWCDEETALALKFRAPDFSDWIGRRKECPRGLVPFAIRGVRAAFENGWPVAWTGTPERAAVEAVVRAAFPGEEVVWLSEDAPFDELVSGMKAPEVVAVDARTERALRRARWARAAAGRKTRVVLMTGELEAPGFWPVHDRTMPLSEACERLAAAGARAPGRVAALLDLEPEAVALVEVMLRGDPFRSALGVVGPKTEWQLEEDLDHADAGAAVAHAIAESMQKSQEDLLADRSPPVLRGLAGAHSTLLPFAEWPEKSDHPDTEPWLGSLAAHGHRGEWYSSWVLGASRHRAWGIELALWRPDSAGRDLLDVAWAAASLGEGAVAASWLRRSWQEGRSNDDLRKAFEPVLAKISAERNPRALLDLLQGAAKNWNAAVVSPDAEARFWRLDGVACGLAAVLLFVGAALIGTWNDSTRQLLLSIGLLGIAFVAFYARSRRAKELTRKIERRLKIPCLEEPIEEERRRQGTERVPHTTRLLGEGSRAEATRTVEQPLMSKDAPASTALLLLAARLLAETGRAREAMRALLHLTATSLPATGNLRATPEPGASDDLFLRRLLEQPAGVLGNSPEAYLTLVDALLKQGRYPEALLVARGALAKVAPIQKGKAVSELAAREADLERRIGAAAE